MDTENARMVECTVLALGIWHTTLILKGRANIIFRLWIPVAHRMRWMCKWMQGYYFQKLWTLGLKWLFNFCRNAVVQGNLSPIRSSGNLNSTVRIPSDQSNNFIPSPNSVRHSSTRVAFRDENQNNVATDTVRENSLNQIR